MAQITIDRVMAEVIRWYTSYNKIHIQFASPVNQRIHIVILKLIIAAFRKTLQYIKFKSWNMHEKDKTAKGYLDTLSRERVGGGFSWNTLLGISPKHCLVFEKLLKKDEFKDLMN